MILTNESISMPAVECAGQIPRKMALIFKQAKHQALIQLAPNHLHNLQVSLCSRLRSIDPSNLVTPDLKILFLL